MLTTSELLTSRPKPAIAKPTPAMLDVTLRRPATADSVLKDTLTEQTAAIKLVPTPLPSAHGRKAASAIAQRKLAEHLYYPPEAIASGLEGEVRLLLTLAENGTVVDATVAGSSGHAILDQAAVRAAHAMGALPGVNRRELILPVVFQLKP
ncbi:MAG TPA: TonB family protein [Rhodocyclaceae bacterium]|nr:TonB family protein [Rhodocyclaceae bacterium]